MELEVFPTTYSKHQCKIWKKNKTKRLTRKLVKLSAKRRVEDGGAAAVVMVGMMSGGRDEEEEEKERERLKEEFEIRAEKNKLWRESRERERLGIPDKSKKKVDKNLRNEKIGCELVCQNCSDELMSEIWQCGSGHPVCGNCFDKETYEEMKRQSLNERYSSSQASQSSKSSIASRSNQFSARSVSDDGSDTALSANLSFLEISSYIRPKKKELDFFENTLNIRKDAILAYNDYNAELEESVDVEESLTFSDTRNVLDNENEFYNRFLKEECPPPYAASVDCVYLKPVTFSEMMENEERKTKEAVESNWKLDFEKKKRKLDFFANTLDIRKDAIGTYADYSKLLEENQCREELSNSSDEDDNDSSTECEDDTDSETSEDTLIVDCPVCNQPIMERNLQAEKISKLFYSMMEFRNKME
eukprot:GFUD01018544.1.p1 GENE.GFUD01018544.1~~GFUD01018544.1.p1  ORF type:complete len:417 (-),score=122.09 GFUD01018544.1:341-1591(-)